MSLLENVGGSASDLHDGFASASEAVRQLHEILYGAQSTTAQHSTRAWLFVSHASTLLIAGTRALEVECFCRTLRPAPTLPLALALDIVSEVCPHISHCSISHNETRMSYFQSMPSPRPMPMHFSASMYALVPPKRRRRATPSTSCEMWRSALKSILMPTGPPSCLCALAA
jgi:hypothetical protein